jgi:hypothetical protein
MTIVIGIDFDNTIICYDEVFHGLAVEAGLVDFESPRKQKVIREAARRSPEGDIAWQRLQGFAYGPRIRDATPAEGALAFLKQCCRAGIETHIISHKTRFASIDPSGTDLQWAAQSWLEHHGFFSEDTGLDSAHFHCGATRQEKVALIKRYHCTHFIDDLVETFQETEFPVGIQPILYVPGEATAPTGLPTLWMARSWVEISERILLA